MQPAYILRPVICRRDFALCLNHGGLGLFFVKQARHELSMTRPTQTLSEPARRKPFPSLILFASRLSWRTETKPCEALMKNAMRNDANAMYIAFRVIPLFAFSSYSVSAFTFMRRLFRVSRNASDTNETRFSLCPVRFHQPHLHLNNDMLPSSNTV